MEIKKAESMARDCINYFLRSIPYQFKWDRSVRRFGLCSQRQQFISMSEKLTLLNNEEQFLDTLLHEISHALSPRDSHHNHQWKKIAQSIGCSGERCYSNGVITPKATWQLICSVCNRKFLNPRFRRFKTEYLHCGTTISWIRTR